MLGSAQDKKKPNRSNESKAKAAAKRSTATKAVKVWEALNIHIEKGVSVMTDIDDIAGLHKYIGNAEASCKIINDLTDLFDAKVQRLRAENSNKEMRLELVAVGTATTAGTTFVSLVFASLIITNRSISLGLDGGVGVCVVVFKHHKYGQQYRN